MHHIQTAGDAARGKNGHYVNPEQVRYGIYEVMTNDEGQSWAQIIDTTAVGVTTYDFGITPDEGQQSKAWYAIAAINEMGNSGIYGFDNILVKGRPYTLPFNETFARMQGNGSFYDVQYRADSTPDPYIADVSHDEASGSGSLMWKPRFLHRQTHGGPCPEAHAYLCRARSGRRAQQYQRGGHPPGRRGGRAAQRQLRG